MRGESGTRSPTAELNPNSTHLERQVTLILDNSCHTTHQSKIHVSGSGGRGGGGSGGSGSGDRVQIHRRVQIRRGSAACVR